MLDGRIVCHLVTLTRITLIERNEGLVEVSSRENRKREAGGCEYREYFLKSFAAKRSRDKGDKSQQSK